MNLKKIWRLYADQINYKNPVKAKILTAVTMFTLGDITCQMGIEHQEKWDKPRTAKVAFIAGSLLNPTA